MTILTSATGSSKVFYPPFLNMKRFSFSDNREVIYPAMATIITFSKCEWGKKIGCIIKTKNKKGNKKSISHLRAHAAIFQVIIFPIMQLSTEKNVHLFTYDSTFVFLLLHFCTCSVFKLFHLKGATKCYFSLKMDHRDFSSKDQHFYFLPNHKDYFFQ